MTSNYGVRYLEVDDFINYCNDLNIKTDKFELESYEKDGIMFPIARCVFPEDYVRLNFYAIHDQGEFPSPDQWPEIQRLSDKPRHVQEQYADLKDEELIDSFDREIGKNPFLFRPTSDTYVPWGKYEIKIPYGDNLIATKSIAEHYYGYWQVYQLSYLKQFPDLYNNKILLKHISDDNKQRYCLPRAPEIKMLRNFQGLSSMFDALSFWITVYTREYNRTFALIPEKYNVKYLNTDEHQAYKNRLISDAKLVQERYLINVENSFKFLSDLIGLYNDYQGDEHYKLSKEMENDIINQVILLELLNDWTWESVTKELEKQYAYWPAQTLRHLNILTKERDDAYELIKSYSDKYTSKLAEVNITTSSINFATSEINELMDYCENEDLTILITALSGMTATQEEYQEKFRRVNLYTNLKNITTGFEFLLKSVVKKSSASDKKLSLKLAIQKIMKKEAWFQLFIDKYNDFQTDEDNSIEFFSKLNSILEDQEFVENENNYWARIFLIASLTRNLTVHLYPDDDWFYGEPLGEMLQAAIYAILYSWKVAKKNGWV